MNDFEEFPKIYRWSRDLVITEKIDGTSAQVCIEFDPHSNGDREKADNGGICIYHEAANQWYSLRAGSRNRWITPENDNYGFARWAYEHAQELVEGLGEGRHYGEWWGSGIQRGYGLKEKRFSLFNTSRWTDDGVRPKCCHVVPVVYQGMNAPGAVESSIEHLRQFGSVAAPGYMNPEGIVIFHVPSQHMFKKTVLKDDEHKGQSKQ